jgi:hypothetical protein
MAHRQKRGSDTNTILRTQAGVQEAVLKVMQEIGQGFRKSISDLRRDLVNAKQAEQAALITTFLWSHRAHLTPVEQAFDRNVQEIARASFLPSLHFQGIEDREIAIAKAHKDTFQWLLKRDSHRDVSWHNFAEWVSDREAPHNIYWVTGKPGSGKSTLMKFLADSTTTSELLSKWASPDYLYTTKCFFWSPGTPLQKSMEGLLRTLLFQIFGDSKTDRAVIQFASPWRWYALVSGNIMHDPWSTGELLNAFASAVRQLARHSKLFLFVDGLDEFGHDNHEQQELVDLFLSLQEHRNVKMCLSSRPWNIFEDAFDGFPSLRLEDLTRDDIVKFVHANCDDSKAFRDRPSGEQSLLKGEIVKKSDGVFLWVRLVVRRLLVEIRDGHRSPATFLDEIPKGLDEYFEYMLQKITPEKKAQASRILQVMVGTRFEAGNPTLMTLSFTDEDIADFASAERVIQEGRDDIEIRITSLKRLFQSQCMDLLVIFPVCRDRSSTDLPWEAISVAYIHRSVNEFLRSRKAQELLERYTERLISVPRYMANSSLTQILFMNRFPTASELEERERKSLILEYFHRFVENLKLIDNAADFPVARVYDMAVAMALPILKDEQTYGRSSQARRSRYLDPIIIANVFKRQDCKAADDPLLVALVYRLDAYAETRLVSDLDETSVKTCFAAALFYDQRPDMVPMLLLILKRGRTIQSPLTIHELVDTFHSKIDDFSKTDQEAARQYASVTLSLIDRTSGMRGSPAALQSLSAKIEESITRTYGSSVSDALVKYLRTVQTSWVRVMPQSTSADTASRSDTSCCVVC